MTNHFSNPRFRKLAVRADINDILDMFDESEKMIYQGLSTQPNLSYEHGVLNTLKWLFGETSELPIDQIENSNKPSNYPIKNNCHCHLCQGIWE